MNFKQQPFFFWFFPMAKLVGAESVEAQEGHGGGLGVGPTEAREGGPCNADGGGDGRFFKQIESLEVES